MKTVLNPKQHAADSDDQQSLNDQIVRYQDDHEELSRHIAEYERVRTNWYANAKNQETQRRSTQFAEVIQWLRSPAISLSDQSFQDEFRAVWSQNGETGGWVFDEHYIHHFIHADTPNYSMLWMTGKKGAGAYDL